MNRTFVGVAPSSLRLICPSTAYSPRLSSRSKLETRSIMQLRFSSFAAALALGPANAWTTECSIPRRPPAIAVSSRRRVLKLNSNPFLSASSGSSLSSVALNSVAEAIDLPAKSQAFAPTGKVVAEGSVVSSFPGGLFAVRLEDEFASTPESEGKEDASSSSIGGDLIGRQVLFPGGLKGVVVTHRPPVVFVFCDIDELSQVTTYEEGGVQVLDTFVSVTLSNHRSSSVDCFGRSLLKQAEPLPTNENASSRAIFAPIPQVKDIALINTPMVTGITMIDALAPIGRGQNMLLVGHDLDDMREYVCDVLSSQTNNGGKTKCVYAACQDRKKIEALLRDAGLADDVTLVASSKNDESSIDQQSKAAEATAIAAAACAIAESYALEEGLDSLVIVDTIDQHKFLWDATTRVLVDVFGVEAVVKGDREGGASSEMRAFYSSLIQRSAQYKKKKGGGSVTLLLLNTIPSLAATESGDVVFSPSDFENSSTKVKERIELLVKRKIPLTTANLRKIGIPIPSDAEGARRLALQHIDDLISMSDGQIWMDEQLEQAGRCPPIDAQRSVTRIGIGADTESRADAPAMRRVVEGLRLDFAQAASMDGADVGTTASIRQMRKSKALLLAMHQPSGTKGRSLAESCVAMIAASRGHLDAVIERGVEAGSKEGDEVMTDLLIHVKTSAGDIMEEIDLSQDMSEESMTKLEAAIEEILS